MLLINSCKERFDFDDSDDSYDLKVDVRVRYHEKYNDN
jgi:hypothetical protein